MDVPVDAATLVYGVFLAGMGRMDVDDVHFLPVPVGAMSTTVFEESQLKLKQGETYTPPSIVQDAPANLDFERVPGTGSERRGPLARRAWGDARRDAGQGLWQGGRGPPAAGSGSTHGTWPITRIAFRPSSVRCSPSGANPRGCHGTRDSDSTCAAEQTGLRCAPSVTSCVPSGSMRQRSDFPNRC